MSIHSTPGAENPDQTERTQHDDMNVLVLGARVIGRELARELVGAFLGATFIGEERHRRRLEKIRALEARYGRQATGAKE